MEIKDIAFFCPFVGTSGLSISHQISNTRQLFDKSDIVTRCYYTFVIYIDDVVAHHFAGTHFSKRSEYIAYKLYEIGRTGHMTILGEEGTETLFIELIVHLNPLRRIVFKE